LAVDRIPVLPTLYEKSVGFLVRTSLNRCPDAVTRRGVCADSKRETASAPRPGLFRVPKLEKPNFERRLLKFQVLKGHDFCDRKPMASSRDPKLLG